MDSLSCPKLLFADIATTGVYGGVRVSDVALESKLTGLARVYREKWPWTKEDLIAL